MRRDGGLFRTLRWRSLEASSLRAHLCDALLVDHEPEVADRSFVEWALCRDVRLACSIVVHVVGVDIVAVFTTCSVQSHPAVIVRQQVGKPVQFGVDGLLGDRARERRPGRQFVVPSHPHKQNVARAAGQ